MERSRLIIVFALVLAVLGGVAAANLGQERLYFRAPANFTRPTSRDPNNWWDDVNDVYIMNGLLEVFDVNVRDQLDVNDVNIAGELILQGFSAGSVLFTDVNGLVTEDNTNFSYNDSTNVLTIRGIGDGGLTSYDLKVGDTDGSPTYGMIQMGNSVIGRTSFNVGNIDLDGAILVRNISGPVTGEIEFVWTESTGDTCRFALPKSAVGNATYNSRSMLLAGPAPADTDFVKVTYWQGQGIFDNLACDTDGTGADLGVQNDLEVEGDIFTDDIKESTSGAGVGIGDGTNEAHVEADGDTYWAGTGGLIYGELFVDAEFTVSPGDANPEEVADAGGDGWTIGLLNQVTFPTGGDEHYLTVPIAGVYKVIWHLSVHKDAGPGTSIHGGIMVDSAVIATERGEDHSDVGATDVSVSLGSVALIDCPNGTEEISLWVSNDQSNDVHVDHGTVVITLIGGT